MRKRLIVAALTAAALGVMAGSALAAAGPGALIFDSSADSGPKSNLPSYGAEAYSFAQIGGEATFAGSKRKLTNAVVTLSSWACVDGTWQSGCVTPAGAKYSLPITLNIYDTGRRAPHVQDADVRRLVPPVRQSGQVPTRRRSGTRRPRRRIQRYGAGRDVHIRPDHDPSRDRPLRDHLWDHPLRAHPDCVQDCSTTAAGCFYDSLNVAVTHATSVGTGTFTLELDANGRAVSSLSASPRPPCSSRPAAET